VRRNDDLKKENLCDIILVGRQTGSAMQGGARRTREGAVWDKSAYNLKSE
jgi:hypothetical protein